LPTIHLIFLDYQFAELQNVFNITKCFFIIINADALSFKIVSHFIQILLIALNSPNGLDFHNRNVNDLGVSRTTQLPERQDFNFFLPCTVLPFRQSGCSFLHRKLRLSPYLRL